MGRLDMNRVLSNQEDDVSENGYTPKWSALQDKIWEDRAGPVDLELPFLTNQILGTPSGIKHLVGQ